MRVAVPLSLRGLGLGPLFVAASRHGELRLGVALEPNGLKQMLRRLGRQTGIPKIRAHRFRHTFATWAIQQDTGEFDVQYLLGHSSPDNGPALLRHLQLRAGRSKTCCVLAGGAAGNTDFTDPAPIPHRSF